MTTLLAIVLCVTLAAYTVAGVVDIFAAKKTCHKLDELVDMVLTLRSKVIGLQKRIDALEATQAQAPRLVSLKPEGKVACVHAQKGGRK